MLITVKVSNMCCYNYIYLKGPQTVALQGYSWFYAQCPYDIDHVMLGDHVVSEKEQGSSCKACTLTPLLSS